MPKSSSEKGKIIKIVAVTKYFKVSDPDPDISTSDTSSTSTSSGSETGIPEEVADSEKEDEGGGEMGEGVEKVDVEGEGEGEGEGNGEKGKEVEVEKEVEERKKKDEDEKGEEEEKTAEVGKEVEVEKVEHTEKENDQEEAPDPPKKPFYLWRQPDGKPTSWRVDSSGMFLFPSLPSLTPDKSHHIKKKANNTPSKGPVLGLCREKGDRNPFRWGFKFVDDEKVLGQKALEGASLDPLPRKTKGNKRKTKTRGGFFGLLLD